MRGVARTTGAISIVNALACGIGCAAAVDLPVEAEVEMVASSGGGPRWTIDPVSDTPLTRAALRHASGVFGPGQVVEGTATVRSEVPPGRGLKSSSAVSAALVLAVAHAFGRTPRPEAAARASAEVSQSVGVSATGAFDDAMAAITGEVVVTDNPSRIVLHRSPPDPSWVAVLWIPPDSHVPAPDAARAFRELEGAGREVAALALAGEFPAAMNENTLLVERAMGYEYRGLREELSRRGALAAGVSGLGPTIAAITQASRATDVAGAFPIDRGEVRHVRFGGVAGSPGPR